MKRSGSEWEWNYQGERVTIRGNVWFNQYTQQGGDAVDFLRYFYNYSEEAAIEALSGGVQQELTSHGLRPKLHQKENSERPILKVPVANESMRRVFAYLCQTRGINPAVVSDFAHAHLLYETAEHHNAMFVGRDDTGSIRHVHLRGTLTDSHFRQTAVGSRGEYSFSWKGTGQKLYVFEAPVDMLSYVSLFPEDWQENSYVALCGVGIAPIERFLDTAPQLSEVILCLDNDMAGHAAARRIAKQLLNEWNGLSVSAHFPDLKDWNEQLTHEQRIGQEQETGMADAMSL